MSKRILSLIKSKLFTPGPAPRTIRAGILRGITMELDPASQTQILFGLYEREIFGAFRRFSKEVRTTIDVGANDGLYTLYFLKKTPVQKVFAFEPHPECRDRLKANLSLNGLEDDARLQIIPHYVNRYNNQNTSTLDSLIPKIETPCLIKMDIDTAEVNALLGASELMRIPGVSWIIETHSPALEVECARILSEAGCRVQIIRNAWWRFALPEQRPIEHNRWLSASRE